MPARLPTGRIVPCVRLVAVVLFLVVGGPLAAADGDAALRVVSSGRQDVVLAIDLPPPAWQQAALAAPARPAWDAILPGFTVHGVPGQSRVPRAGSWLVLPPGTVPRLEVVAEEWEPLLESRNLAIEPVPVMQDDPETGRYFEQPLIPQPGEPLPLERIPPAALADMQRPDPALAAGPAVRLGEPVWWRGRRIVACTLVPLRVDGEGRATATLRSGQWRVAFVPEAAAKHAPARVAPRLSGKHDEVFAGYFLNGAMLPQWATESAQAGHAAAKVARPAARGTPLGYPEVRVPVRRSGLHRIRGGELQAAGLLPQVALRRDQIRLYQRRYLPQLDDPLAGEAPPYLEIEVPIHIVGTGEEFGPDDIFLFWGLRPRDDRAFTYLRDGTAYAVPAVDDTLEINNENNIYWLQLAAAAPGESWARMEVASLPPAQGPPAVSYRRTDYYAEALAYRENIPAIDVDRYYFNRNSADSVRVNLTFWSAVPGQAGATLQAGIANVSTESRRYLLDLVSGGAVLASLPDFTSSSRYVLTYQAALPASAMTGADFALRLRRPLTSGGMTQPVDAFLDWIEVRYDALYAAPFGRLLFPGGDDAASSDLEVTGFATEDIGLIEVTDPRRPVFIALSRSNVTSGAGGGYQLSLRVDQSGGQRQFFAAARLTSDGVPDIRYSDASLAADPVVPTRLAEAGAEVLVVAHPEFRAATEAWVAYRRGRAGPRGLTFQIVEPQQLYDWYAGGMKDPWAIKRLVDHALAHPAWGSWALVLVGSANENPREVGVLSSGRQWSRDWVPTHFHVQSAGGDLAPEVLASDKWFVTQAAGAQGFPDNLGQPPDLYVGRFPVHTPAELQLVLTKIQQVETVAPAQDWRRRAIFIADDAYGTGSLGSGGFYWRNRFETAFETSELYAAGLWENNAGQVPLQSDRVLLRPFMAGLYPEADAATNGLTLGRVREYCRNSGAPEALIAALSRGGTLAHFQGHANHWLLTHEIWFEHDMRTPANRRDVDLLTNHGKPWVFCGMGCHLGDFIQNVAAPSGNVEPGLGEKLLLWTPAGAVAVYASSGYEFLSLNRALSENFVQRLTLRPPNVTVRGEATTSRWRLGELMWTAEADQLAQNSSSLNRQMVYQYLVLGDPLMVLDAGPPEVEAALQGTGGGPLPDLQADLTAMDATRQRTLTVRARDEAGIDRLLVLDSTGRYPPAATVQETPFYTNGSRQIMDYVVTLPVRPYAHQLLVRVYDSAASLAGDAHALVTLNVDQQITAFITATGEPLDPATFTFVEGEPVPLELAVDSAAWFDETTTIALTSDQLDVAAVVATVVDARTLRVSCTVSVPENSGKAKVERGLDLAIDGYVSYVPLEVQAIPGGDDAISRLVSFPNPMRDDARFVFATNLRQGQGKVRVWTVSGREVAVVPFDLSGSGQEIVSWDGRDRQGDRLANGTYLYRVELAAADERARSGMQRLVIMR